MTPHYCYEIEVVETVQRSATVTVIAPSNVTSDGLNAIAVAYADGLNVWSPPTKSYHRYNLHRKAEVVSKVVTDESEADTSTI